MTTSDLTTTSRRDPARLRELVLTSLVGGAVVYAASLVIEVLEAGDAVFFPFVLLLPVVVGAVMGARGRRSAQAAGVFVVGYLGDLVHDWIVTGGDQVFHLVLAVLTGALAALAATVTRRVRKAGADRRPDPAP
jgi:peptidoglycan/LPS O-acetylase OafA/YrhL